MLVYVHTYVRDEIGRGTIGPARKSVRQWRVQKCAPPIWSAPQAIGSHFFSKLIQ